MWQPIETAPKDGTLVDLTWMDKGRPQDLALDMRWDHFATNPLVGEHRGLWVYRNRKGEIQFTWSEAEPIGAPTHWRRPATP